MHKHPSARELVNKALNKKLSPESQAVLDEIKRSLSRDKDDDNTFADSSSTDFDPDHIDRHNPDGNGGDHHEPGPKSGKQTQPDALARKANLLQLIEAKLAEATTKESTKQTQSSPAKIKANRANSQDSTGPRTPEGKAKVSANALKAGYFANVQRLNPQDATAYQDAVEDMRMGLHPDGPVEEQLIRELAMFRARLLRLESAEYALICSGIEDNPSDARQIAAAMINNADAIERLQKAEVHLRRAYNRTWDRLERMQKERKKLPFNEAQKQSQIWATAEAIRTTCPKCAAADHPGSDPAQAWKRHVPPLHPALDQKGNLKKHSKDHPMYRPSKDDEEDHQ